MLTKPFAALALAFLPVSSALGGEITYQSQARIDPMEGSARITVPSPGPLLGVPDAMQLSLQVFLRGRVGIESLSKAGGAGAMLTGFGADLSTLDGEFVLGASSLAIQRMKFVAFDGVEDLAGSSGQVLRMDLSTNRRQQRLAGSLPGELFKRSATKGGLSFNVAGGASLGIHGAEDYALSEDLELIVQIQVVYLYGADADSRMAAGFPAQRPGESPVAAQLCCARSDEARIQVAAC